MQHGAYEVTKLLRTIAVIQPELTITKLRCRLDVNTTIPHV
jgi:hypothetical protein